MNIFKRLGELWINHQKKQVYGSILVTIQNVDKISKTELFRQLSDLVHKYLVGDVSADYLKKKLIYWESWTRIRYPEINLIIEAQKKDDLREVAEFKKDSDFLKRFQNAKTFIALTMPIILKIGRILLAMISALDNRNNKRIEKLASDLDLQIKLFDTLTKRHFPK